MNHIPHKLKTLQYSGDANGSNHLYDVYNVDGFLSAREADEKERGESLRHQLAKDGVQLNELLSPRIYNVVHHIQDVLGVDGAFDVFCVRDNNINAFAYLDNTTQNSQHIIGLTSAALENLDDEEIAFLLGHELGHFMFGHNRLMGLLNQDERAEKVTVLPYMGECFFLRWRKKSEISADRIGLIASASYEASARALIKAGFGLSDKNLNLDVDTLLLQIESLKEQPEIIESAYRSHPLLPLRLKALHLFSQAVSDKKDLVTTEADAQIDELFTWARHYPRKPLHEAVMQVVAITGLRMISSEGDVDEEEVKSLIYILHNYFTDSPEEELILDQREQERRLKNALEIISNEGDDGDTGFIISRLADIALADGKLLDQEAGLILETAEILGMSAKRAYAIIIAAAQTVGFTVDHQMKELTHKVRMQLALSVKQMR